jgi:hypothetical protein
MNKMTVFIEQASDHFPKYHMKTLLEDCIAKVGRENIRLRSIYDEGHFINRVQSNSPSSRLH